VGIAERVQKPVRGVQLEVLRWESLARGRRTESSPSGSGRLTGYPHLTGRLPIRIGPEGLADGLLTSCRPSARNSEERSDSRVRCVTRSVAVEKLDLRKNGMILGDGKMARHPYESLVGHPDATLFWTSSRI
jgi:hypothetical protein